MSNLAPQRYFLPTSVGTMIGRYVVVIPTH